MSGVAPACVKNLRWRSRGWVVREGVGDGKVGCSRGMVTGWKEWSCVGQGRRAGVAGRVVVEGGVEPVEERVE